MIALQAPIGAFGTRASYSQKKRKEVEPAKMAAQPAEGDERFLFSLFGELAAVYGRARAEKIFQKHYRDAMSRMVGKWRNVPLPAVEVADDAQAFAVGDSRIDSSTHMWTLHLANQ